MAQPGKKTPRTSNPAERRTALMQRPNAVEDVAVRGFRLGAALESHLGRFFQSYGLTPLQFNALRILYVRDPENTGLPTGAIGARLTSLVPDVPRLIDRLVERGLIERARATDDRRVVRVRLTSAGKALVEEVHEPLLASNRALFRHMSESELVSLADGLARALAGPLSSGRELDDSAGSKPPPSSEVERVDEKKRLPPRRRKGR